MKPFEGFRVLDLTHVLAGPFSTYQLAVMGADVIKVEPPNNPDMMRPEGSIDSLNEEGRGVRFLGQSANKRAITLNLKSDEGRDLFRKLVATADVVVENYTAGVMEGFGLGYAALCEINPKLIYCTVTGFGHTGPKKDHPAYDNVIQAFSGLMAATGSAETAPVRVGPPVLDYGTGAQTAFAISASLLRRERTGKGQRIDVAMLDAALMLMTMTIMEVQSDGGPPPAPGNSSLSNAGYACYPTKNGLLMIGAFTAKQHRRLWTVLGREATGLEIERQGIDVFPERMAADAAVLGEIFLTKTADEWEDILNQAHVPAARVRTLDEALDHDQVASRGVLQDLMTNPNSNAMFRTPVSAAMFSEDGPVVTAPPARLGEHNETIFAELGISVENLEVLRGRGVV